MKRSPRELIVSLVFIPVIFYFGYISSNIWLTLACYYIGLLIGWLATILWEAYKELRRKYDNL